MPSDGLTHFYYQYSPFEAGEPPTNAKQEKYKALIWLRKWESNPLLLAYETSEIPYLPSAIVFFQDYK